VSYCYLSSVKGEGKVGQECHTAVRRHLESITVITRQSRLRIAGLVELRPQVFQYYEICSVSSVLTFGFSDLCCNLRLSLTWTTALHQTCMPTCQMDKLSISHCLLHILVSITCWLLHACLLLQCFSLWPSEFAVRDSEAIHVCHTCVPLGLPPSHQLSSRYCQVQT
jgi:hypothetical protein